MAVRSQQQQTKKQIASEHLGRFGVLMGGPKEILWSGVGEMSIGVGLHTIPRRELIEFTSFECGGRLESVYGEESLSRHMVEYDLSWHKNPKRIMVKSAKNCVEDVFQVYGREGWAILKSLTGKDFDTANDLFNSVLPEDVAQKSLVDVIRHLEQSDYSLTDPRFPLRHELLKAGRTAHEHYTTYTQSLRDEIQNAGITGMGLKSLNETTTELFRELQIDLPSEVVKKGNIEMGKAIAEAVTTSQKPATIPGLTDLVRELMEQNRLLREKVSKNQPEETKEDSESAEQIAA